LDALFSHVYEQYFTDNATSTAIKLGQINVYEWDCDTGGDNYSTVSTDGTQALFQAGSAMMPAATEGKALNIFLVSNITYSGSGTVLGLAGGIGAPMINGTAESGLVFSSFNKLSTYNPSCSSDPCPASIQESAFLNMGGTIAHEMGHFLGLNHPSESD